MRLTFVALPLLLVVAGCGARPAGEGGQEDPLRGRTFLATAMTDNGQPRALVAGTEVSIEFVDDGRLIAQAGCNMMQGEVATADGKLTVEGLSTTDMGCDQALHDQDSFVGRVLSGSPSWQLDGDRLTITAGDTKLDLAPREAVHPDRQLVGTTWVLDTMVSGEVASSMAAGGPEVTVVFDEERVVADTHCNGASADYTVADDRIVFQPGMSTLKLCSPEIMAAETAMQNVLDGEATYEITADRLTITNVSGEGIALHAQ